MDKITLYGAEFLKAKDIEQFRHQEKHNRQRRNGLPYYLWDQSLKSPIIRMVIDDYTNETWLRKAIDNGWVLLEKIHYDITLAAADSKKNFD